jgi:hypothetical protein
VKIRGWPRSPADCRGHSIDLMKEAVAHAVKEVASFV